MFDGHISFPISDHSSVESLVVPELRLVERPMAHNGCTGLDFLLLAVFIPLISCLPFSLDLPFFSQQFALLQPRQVGQGVNGNQTGNSGSVTSGGTGDGNGVGFAGIGNDIDTGTLSMLLRYLELSGRCRSMAAEN